LEDFLYLFFLKNNNPTLFIYLQLFKSDSIEQRIKELLNKWQLQINYFRFTAFECLKNFHAQVDKNLLINYFRDSFLLPFNSGLIFNPNKRINEWKCKIKVISVYLYLFIWEYLHVYRLFFVGIRRPTSETCESSKQNIQPKLVVTGLRTNQTSRWPG